MRIDAFCSDFDFLATRCGRQGSRPARFSYRDHRGETAVDGERKGWAGGGSPPAPMPTVKPPRRYRLRDVTGRIRGADPAGDDAGNACFSNVLPECLEPTEGAASQATDAHAIIDCCAGAAALGASCGDC